MQGASVSFKDEVKYVKDELSSDEKLLESAFRLERIYRKYKVTIWAAVVLIIVGFGGKALWGVYQEHKLEQANQALLSLEKNPADTQALETLKADNPKLYSLYLYATAVKSRNVQELKKLASSSDKRLQDLARYHEAVLQSRAGDSRYYPDLSRVEKAYLALKAGKKQEAREILALVPENSPVAGVARLLRHATIQ